MTAAIGAVTDSTGTITVTAGALASLTVSPDTATLTADQTRAFTFVGKDADGNTVSPLGTVTWGVTGGIGTIDGAGLFNARTVGTGTVTATIGAVTDSTGSITVTAGALASLTVSPDTATLTADETRPFTVTGRDADGNAVTSLGTITWSLTGSIGTINPSTGLFTANTVGKGTVRAKSSLGGITDTSGTITVTAGALAGLTVSPDTATLTADETRQFTVTGRDADGNG